MAVVLENLPIWADIKKIIESEAQPVRYEYEAIVHTEDMDLDVFKLISLDIVRDYSGNIGDFIHAIVSVPLGDYVKNIFPYRGNLEVTIKRRLLAEVGGNVREDVPEELERYKAVFNPNLNMNVKGGEYDQYDLFTLNNMDILQVHLQLIDRALELLRIKTVSGVFSNATPEGLLHAVFGSESSKIMIDGKPAIDGMDIRKPNKETKLSQIVIPNGLKLTSLPTYLQEKRGGVYVAGIGTYFQKYKEKRTWFIYPLYDVKRFDEDVNKAVFYMAPENRLSGVERTYRKEGSVIHILATGGKSYKDGADTDFMNDGVGFRMSDANAFMKKPVSMKDEGPVGKRSQLNYEVAMLSKPDGVNYAPVSGSRISGNPFSQFSRVVQRNVARIDLVWENSNPSELYPGMPCQYTFMENDTLTSLKGIVLFVHTYVQLAGNNLLETRHSTMSFITIAAETLNNAPDPKKPTTTKVNGKTVTVGKKPS